MRRGGEALAHGLTLAYGELPHENVSFVGCHDNMTSFDTVGDALGCVWEWTIHVVGPYCLTRCPSPAIPTEQVTEKASLTATAAERMRMSVMCLALVALSQGVPFFHAGDSPATCLDLSLSQCPPSPLYLLNIYPLDPLPRRRPPPEQIPRPR